MTKDTPLDGIEVEVITPKLDELLRRSLHNGLVALDKAELPSYEAVAGLAINADVEALYAPYHRDLHTFLWGATNAHLLMLFREADPAAAEHAAATVLDFLESGDAYPEWIWQWADDRAMDTEKIVADARARHAEWLAAPRKNSHVANDKAAAETGGQS